MMSKPHKRRVLHADIANAFDPECCIGELDWPELTPLQKQACLVCDMVPIFDAETELVALVPKSMAEILLEIINRFEPDILTEDEWKMIGKGASIDSIERHLDSNKGT